MKLEQLGWNSFFEQGFYPFRNQGFLVGRVASEQKQIYGVLTEQGYVLARISGRLRYGAKGRDDLPAVGDWVVIAVQSNEGKAVIHAILPRFSKFSRKAAGTSVKEQIIATNINTVFLVTALNNDFNLRRLERYLTLAWESGANPVVILSKADLCLDSAERIKEVEKVAIGAPIHLISTLKEQGLTELQPYFLPGNTVALLGSSGVGKSTLINKLVGKAIREVNEVRQGDDRGRHTTTNRELIVLPGGGMIIDTPGMRELQLWGSEASTDTAFDDIEELARLCRFTDCSHKQEPGCAVQRALKDGNLAAERFTSYDKLKRELAYLSRKENQRELLAEKEKWKKIHKSIRNGQRH